MITRYINDHVVSWTDTGDARGGMRSYAFADAGTTVWIDPVDPGADLDKVLALGPPRHVLVTVGAHDRDVMALAKRYGAEVWVPVGGTRWLPGADHTYDDGARLPAGLQAMRIAGGSMGCSVLHGTVEGVAIAFFGDSVACLEKGKSPWFMRIVFQQAAGIFQHHRFFFGGHKRTALASLQRLRELNLGMAFVTHGEPVIGYAGEYLAESLASW